MAAYRAAALTLGDLKNCYYPLDATKLPRTNSVRSRFDLLAFSTDPFPIGGEINFFQVPFSCLRTNICVLFAESLSQTGPSETFWSRCNLSLLKISTTTKWAIGLHAAAGHQPAEVNGAADCRFGESAGAGARCIACEDLTCLEVIFIIIGVDNTGFVF